MLRQPEIYKHIRQLSQPSTSSVGRSTGAQPSSKSSLVKVDGPLPARLTQTTTSPAPAPAPAPAVRRPEPTDTVEARNKHYLIPPKSTHSSFGGMPSILTQYTDEEEEEVVEVGMEDDDDDVQIVASRPVVNGRSQKANVAKRPETKSERLPSRRMLTQRKARVNKSAKKMEIERETYKVSKMTTQRINSYFDKDEEEY